MDDKNTEEPVIMNQPSAQQGIITNKTNSKSS